MIATSSDTRTPFAADISCNAGPKIIFQVDAGFMAVDRDRPFENARFLARCRRRLSLLRFGHSVTAWPSADSSLSGAAHLERLSRP
jgi:hypothetical protein